MQRSTEPFFGLYRSTPGLAFGSRFSGPYGGLRDKATQRSSSSRRVAKRSVAPASVKGMSRSAHCELRTSAVRACNSAQYTYADGESHAGNTERTEPRAVTRPSSKGNTDALVPVRANSSQACRRRRNTVSKTSKVFSCPQQHPCCVSQLVGVRVRGLQTLTVPQSQPYLAEAVHPSLLGRFFRPKNVACELSMKLNVTEENSPWTLDTPGGCGLGSKQNSLQGVSSALKLSDPPVGVVTDVGASPESTRSDANPYQRDNERGTETTHSHSKIDSPKGEALPEPSTHALPLTPEQNSPSAPLSIAPVVKSGQTKILCVSTISPDLPEFNFEEKAIQVTGADSPVALEELGISVVCKKGYKPNCSNNDGFFVSHVRGCTVCCVLDGHGPFGHEVCHVVQQDLLKLTTDNPDLPVKAKRVLREAFLKAHSNLQAKCNPFRLDSKLSGTTVTILVYLREQNKLFVAHVGNSRAVLCKFNKSDSGVHAVDLTVDHTPTNSKELRRIVKAGGQVRAPPGDGFHRIFLANGSLPGLAVARSIGDTLAGSAGVIAHPEIKEYRVDEKRDNFLLLCTDGVWNVISSQEAVEIAHSAKQKEWRTAPEELARESWRRWINEEQIFADDMTVLFLKLC